MPTPPRSLTGETQRALLLEPKLPLAQRNSTSTNGVKFLKLTTRLLPNSMALETSLITISRTSLLITFQVMLALPSRSLTTSLISVAISLARPTTTTTKPTNASKRNSRETPSSSARSLTYSPKYSPLLLPDLTPRPESLDHLSSNLRKKSLPPSPIKTPTAGTLLLLTTDQSTTDLDTS